MHGKTLNWVHEIDIRLIERGEHFMSLVGNLHKVMDGAADRVRRGEV